MALGVEIQITKNENPHNILSVPVLLADVVCTMLFVIVVPVDSHAGNLTTAPEYLLQIRLQYATWRQSVHVFCAPIRGLE